ncbi:hypothetical protein RchiOBHm_Chr2g0141901 [Rosa chinensis]|uniref:Uncharacterized protein n=1 Tax=Rosa chinensis TaxID=74649 RepID=A0A2P6RXR9_ROSCH|nr:hypothetical protein RchiOBHm_Chr2g0141901 [Rosa chinensis]
MILLFSQLSLLSLDVSVELCLWQSSRESRMKEWCFTYMHLQKLIGYTKKINRKCHRTRN